MPNVKREINSAEQVAQWTLSQGLWDYKSQPRCFRIANPEERVKSVQNVCKLEICIFIQTTKNH